MRHGSLFSGIGGFDLAAEWMGWENAFHCEWNEFGQKVLKHHFPEADSYADITQTDFRKYEGSVQIVSGGFPCQPFSQAGKRKGTDDERYLWHEMLRAVQEIKPKYVIAENVYGITNIDGGLVFEQVHLDLEAEGYEVQTFILPACAKDAPHRRDRCWFVAYNNERDRQKNGLQTGKKVDLDRTEGKRNATDSNSIGCERRSQEDGSKEAERYTRVSCPRHEPSRWEDFPTEHPICSGNDGLPDRLDGITFSKWRNESIKAYGNAIVPQVAYELFKAIGDAENLSE